MKKDDLSNEFARLENEVRQLCKDVANLKNTIELQGSASLDDALQMRGLTVFRENPTEGLFIPKDAPKDLKDVFYETLKKYSFRLFLRDLIRDENCFEIRNSTRYYSKETAKKYLDFLEEVGAVEALQSQRYRVKPGPIRSFGPTLEWFIAEIFKREFLSPAIYGVSLKDTPSGGDYDVIAKWEQQIVYVEVKSSPPKGIEIKEVSAFINRINDLIPHVALFFVDTELRMKDKIVVMFEEELKNRYGNKARGKYAIQRLVDELFHINDFLFIVNSRKDVISNIRLCLRHYLSSRVIKV
ncbi:MAG: hypothetical protein ABID54_02690 [Pseudomonadota bacterium]